MNLSAVTSYSASIDAHELELLELDASLVATAHRPTVPAILLRPGQRASVVITPSEDAMPTWLRFLAIEDTLPPTPSSSSFTSQDRSVETTEIIRKDGFSFAEETHPLDINALVILPSSRTDLSFIPSHPWSPSILRDPSLLSHSIEQLAPIFAPPAVRTYLLSLSPLTSVSQTTLSSGDAFSRSGTRWAVNGTSLFPLEKNTTMWIASHTYTTESVDKNGRIDLGYSFEGEHYLAHDQLVLLAGSNEAADEDKQIYEPEGIDIIVSNGAPTQKSGGTVVLHMHGHRLVRSDTFRILFI